MNVPSTLPPIAGSAATAAPAITSQPSNGGGGIADLFASLLASLQGLLPVPAAAKQAQAASGHPACTECTPNGSAGDVAADDGSPDGETTGVAPPAGGTPLADVAQAAVVPAPVAAAADKGRPQVVPANQDAALAAPQPATSAANQAAPNPPAGQVVVAPPIEGELPAQSTPAANPATVSAVQDTLVAAATPVRPDAPPEPQSPLQPLPITVEVVNEGQAKPGPASPASTTAAPVRTVRQLVEEAVTGVRTQAEAAASRPPAASAVTAVAVKPPVEVVPELRPAAPDAAPKSLAPMAAPAVAPSGGEAPISDAATAQPRGAPRVALPQTVDVRDVGDFTVRSVRYLNGRTEEVVTVRLAPRSLGELQIAVRTSADGLEVVLTTATHAARERLEAQMIGLRDLLVRDGVDVHRVTVQTQPHFDLAGQTPSSHQQHHTTGHAARLHPPPSRQPETQPPDQQPMPSGRPHHEGGLNMLA